MYKVNIQVIHPCGDEVLDKYIPVSKLDDLLSLDLPGLYAEAQQNEINDGLDVSEYDEFDEMVGDR